MSRPCSICGHGQRADIDRSLADGASVSGTAKRFGVGRMALQRHRDAHLTEMVAEAADRQSVTAAVEGHDCGALIDEHMQQAIEMRDAHLRKAMKGDPDAVRAWEAAGRMILGSAALMVRVGEMLLRHDAVPPHRPAVAAERIEESK